MPASSFHSSFGGRGMLPPTVIEDPSGSHDGSHSSRNSQSNAHGFANAHGPPRMKRSPYLSAMSGSTKESEDLIALLSRPAAGLGGARNGTGGASAGSSSGNNLGSGTASPEGSLGSAGKSHFFDLKRPSSQAGSPVAEPPPRPLPSLRSALRVGEAPDDLKKNTSVTFSSATKQASQLGVDAERQRRGNAGFSFDAQPLRPPKAGLPGASLRRSDYTAATMMKKSLSIASPQFSLAHQHSLVTANTGEQTRRRDNDTFAEARRGACDGRSKEGEGNASFPIYLGKLPADSGATPSPGPSHPREEACRVLQSRAQSMQILKQHNYEQGRTPLAHARPSNVRMNLTFREMLDEGDGREGDMNVRSRNQQWKEFGTFSQGFAKNHPHMAGGTDHKEEGRVVGITTAAKVGDGEGDQGGGHLSGTKRTLTPSSLTGSNASEGSSKNSRETGFPRTAPVPIGRGRSGSGSHRVSLSVNDLAILRHSASRLKMTSPAPGINSGRLGYTIGPHAPRRPGETLGGDLLSRAEANSVGKSASTSLTHMMSSNKEALSSGSKVMEGGGLSNTMAQLDLFLNKFGNSAPVARGGLGRKTQTVGAGLSYGRANMTTIAGPNGARCLSRFDLGHLQRVTSQLSEMSSQGSLGGSKGGGGRNEEWDLS